MASKTTPDARRKLIATVRTMPQGFDGAALIRRLGYTADEALEAMAWLKLTGDVDLVRTPAPSGVS